MIQIDSAKCVGCGLCADNCIYRVIGIANGTAQRTAEKCILCGHCFAICPHNAVSITDYAQEELEEVIEHSKVNSTLNYDNLLNYIKLRRSIRAFKAQQIDRKTIEMIIDAGRYSPTAKNAQNVSYIVLQHDIPKLRKATVTGFLELVEAGKIIKPAYLDRIDLDKVDYFFRNAPAIILTTSEHTVNAAIASAHMEIAANALGLGVLYIGYFPLVANENEAVKKMLNVSDNKKIITCLCIGYPNVEYKRSAPRYKAQIQWI